MSIGTKVKFCTYCGNTFKVNDYVLAEIDTTQYIGIIDYIEKLQYTYYCNIKILMQKHVLNNLFENVNEPNTCKLTSVHNITPILDYLEGEYDYYRETANQYLLLMNSISQKIQQQKD